jgi:hypothetical protein
LRSIMRVFWHVDGRVVTAGRHPAR